MRRSRAGLLFIAAGGFLFWQGCVAVPPLITVNHRDAPAGASPEVNARLADMERRLERIEQKLDKR